MTTLAPCRYCKGSAFVRSLSFFDARKIQYQIVCNGCGLMTDWKEHREVLIERWNKSESTERVVQLQHSMQRLREASEKFYGCAPVLGSFDDYALDNFLKAIDLEVRTWTPAPTPADLHWKNIREFYGENSEPPAAIKPTPKRRARSFRGD